jgi:hypothetical protein
MRLLSGEIDSLSTFGLPSAEVSRSARGGICMRMVPQMLAPRLNWPNLQAKPEPT